MKKRIFVIVMFSVLVGLAFANFKMMQIGKGRSENVTRYALMIDTSAEHGQVKGHHYYNTYGYFVDRETGLRFTDSINDSLYRQFEKGGNVGIEVSWAYSVDKREQTSKGTLYTVLSFIGWIILLFCTVLLVCTTVVRHVPTTSNKSDGK